MNQRKMCFGSFNKRNFQALLYGLSMDGYVIDGRKTLGITFSTTQIEHINQEIFDQLCAEFGFNIHFYISKAGNFFPVQGAFYIVFDKEILDYKCAQDVLTTYVNSLPPI